MHIIRSIEDAKALEDVEVGVSDWIVVDQERINRFAAATDDYQWIHVDEERAAKELPHGKTIAHGYLTLSLLPSLTNGFVKVENLERAINFGSLYLSRLPSYRLNAGIKRYPASQGGLNG